MAIQTRTIEEVRALEESATVAAPVRALREVQNSSAQRRSVEKRLKGVVVLLSHWLAAKPRPH